MLANSLSPDLGLLCFAFVMQVSSEKKKKRYFEVTVILKALLNHLLNDYRVIWQENQDFI